jgi:hypothetical protein
MMTPHLLYPNKIRSKHWITGSREGPERERERVAMRKIEGAWEKEIAAVDSWATGVVLCVAAKWWIPTSSACFL